jgi:hypothetical protein
MQPFAGEFAIRPYYYGYLTAVNGGGKTTDVMHTDAYFARAWETFRLWVDSATRQWYAFQTFDGHFVTANPPGGQWAPNALRTTAGAICGTEMFRLPLVGGIYNAIQMPTGFYLDAVNGGGDRQGDAIQTDAVVPGIFESFSFARKGDLGTGSKYTIAGISGPGWVNGNAYIAAYQGGNYPGPYGAINIGNITPIERTWTLLKQNDGTYAFKTESGYLLTAIGGGALGSPPGTGFRTDTEQENLGNFEKFTVVDNGDFTAYIKTYAGAYFALDWTHNQITLVGSNDAVRWQFRLLPSPTSN